MVVKKKTTPPAQQVRRSNTKSPVSRKNFTAATVDAAKSAVETLSLNADQKVLKPRRHVTFAGADAPSKPSLKKRSDGALIPRATTTPAAVAARRAAVGGIIEAKKRRRSSEEEDKEEAEDDEEKKKNGADSASEDDSSSDDNDDDDLSDLPDAADDDDDDSACSDEAAWENPFEKAKREGTRLSYPALRLRFLPPEFEEPQLFKFLSQFNGKVINCFCVRSRRTHQSKGIAYVQFDGEGVLETVLEECNGMALGGRAVQAHRVTLHRAMPSKEKAARRRLLAYLYKTHGAKMCRHDVRKKNPVAALIKYSRVERANNEHLKRLGIDYEFRGFQDQLANVPKEMFIKKNKKPDAKKNRAARTAKKTSSRLPGEENILKKSNKKVNGVESITLSSSFKPENVSVKPVKSAATLSAVKKTEKKTASTVGKQRVARK